MDFALEETPQAVQDLAAEVLRRASEHAENAGTSGPGAGEAAWQAMGETGLLSLAVPERLGGAGLGPLATALVLAEVGKRTIAVPALASMAFGTLAVVRHGTREQQDRLLPEMESGRVLTAALNEPSAPMTGTPHTVARHEGDRLVLSGTKTGVLHADRAHRVLVPVTLGGDVGVVLLDPAAGGVSLSAAPTSSGIPASTMTLDGVRVPSEDMLGDTTGRGLLDDIHRCATAGLCAVADGVLAGALELTTEHLRTREQFGRPLATFQAAAQQVADVYVAARTLHLATRSACWRLDEGHDAAEDLDVAALWLTVEIPPAMHTCHHLHGGLGVDTTYPMHRHYSWIKDLAVLAGGVDPAVDRLADRVAKA